MKFLLDTNAGIAIVKRDPRFMTRAREQTPNEFGIPSVAAHELYFGAYKSSHIAENLARTENLRFPIIAFDHEDALEAGQLRASLADSRTPIGPYDVLIAGQAKARNLILITRNLRQFERVQGLRVENWDA